MEDSSESDRRAYHRVPLEFELEVVLKGDQGVKYRERTVLSNISGAGARFISRAPQKFFKGQTIQLAIFLPGTADVAAEMRGEATVVRIDALPRPDQVGNGKGGAIAVAFKSSLIFARLESMRCSSQVHLSEDPA